jgi:hypothetical protein
MGRAHLRGLQRQWRQTFKNFLLQAHGLNHQALRLSWLKFGLVEAEVALGVKAVLLVTAVLVVAAAHMNSFYLKPQTLRLQ